MSQTQRSLISSIALGTGFLFLIKILSGENMYIDPRNVPLVAIADLIATGDPNLDRSEIRGNLVKHAVETFGLDKILQDPRIIRALMGIVWKESDGKPHFYLGDIHAPGGPSIGPMQVYRSSAESVGLWKRPPNVTDDENKNAYARLAHNEDLGIKWGVIEFQHKLKAANGDIPDAIRRYNGGGTHAYAYRDKILNWASDLGWDLRNPPRLA